MKFEELEIGTRFSIVDEDFIKIRTVSFINKKGELEKANVVCVQGGEIGQTFYFTDGDVELLDGIVSVKVEDLQWVKARFKPHGIGQFITQLKNGMLMVQFFNGSEWEFDNGKLEYWARVCGV